MKNGWSLSMPVSMTATVVPVPFQPAVFAWTERILAVLASSRGMLSSSL
ncbi:hypothetical protein ACFQ0B_20990 [Nonomuraea thailandensis]